ncbi:MerR family transcriptional regulator [Acidisoma sp.]|uniref:MerR family transcriptional regulator n=1 Tax=Acidisoma sp. TaxID=1872115 RepID=UPI003B004A0E
MSAIPLPRDDDDQTARVKAKKAPTAFRTISEVADDLHIPQHVLRFWETKFTQVKPLKRGGGRRYYRPDDITLLRRISHLLYTQGYTIKGVQRLLREGGGRLADDIPPPLVDERDTEAEREVESFKLVERERAQPDLPVEPPVATRLPLRFIPRPTAVPPAPNPAELEAENLRQVMMEMLARLEELRVLVASRI